MQDSWIYHHFINTVLFPISILGVMFLIACIFLYRSIKKSKEEQTS